MTRIHLFILYCLSLASIASAAASFCKCTCFTNSTIIELRPKGDTPPSKPKPDDDPSNKPSPSPTTSSPSPQSSSSSSGEAAAAAAQARVLDVLLDKRATSGSLCDRCDRAFCLSQSLPICKDAEEKDVTTKCFQRDSRKDQLIVWSFILATCGLLGWAGLRRVLERVEAKNLQRGQQGAAGGGGSGGGGGGMFARAFNTGGGGGGGGGGILPGGSGRYNPLGGGGGEAGSSR